MELVLFPYPLTQCTVGFFCAKSKLSVLPKSVRIVDLLPVIAVEEHLCGVFSLLLSIMQLWFQSKVEFVPEEL